MARRPTLPARSPSPPPSPLSKGERGCVVGKRQRSHPRKRYSQRKRKTHPIGAARGGRSRVSFGGEAFRVKSIVARPPAPWQVVRPEPPLPARAPALPPPLRR